MNKNIIEELFLTLVLLFMAKWQPSFFFLNYVFFFQAFRWCKPDFCGSVIAHRQKSIQGNTVFLLNCLLFRTLLGCLSFLILLTNQVAIEPVFVIISLVISFVKVIATVCFWRVRLCKILGFVFYLKEKIPKKIVLQVL